MELPRSPQLPLGPQAAQTEASDSSLQWLEIKHTQTFENSTRVRKDPFCLFSRINKVVKIFTVVCFTLRANKHKERQC